MQSNPQPWETGEGGPGSGLAKGMQSRKCPTLVFLPWLQEQNSQQVDSQALELALQQRVCAHTDEYCNKRQTRTNKSNAQSDSCTISIIPITAQSNRSLLSPYHIWWGGDCEVYSIMQVDSIMFPLLAISKRWEAEWCRSWKRIYQASVIKFTLIFKRTPRT